MKCGVVVFPGSNCDHDCFHILKHVFKIDAEYFLDKWAIRSQSHILTSKAIN